MEKSPSLEANICSGDHEITRILLDLNVTSIFII
jgi:hypothetical protein